MDDEEREYREAHARWVAEIDEWWVQLTHPQRLQAMVLTSNPGSKRHEAYLALLRELPPCQLTPPP